MRRLVRFLEAEDGPTTVEYAVLLALILMAFFASVQLIGQQTNASYDHSSERIDESFRAAGVGSI